MAQQFGVAIIQGLGFSIGFGIVFLIAKAAGIV